MSNETDFGTAIPKRQRKRRYKSKADMAAEIRELKAALKAPAGPVDRKLQQEHDHAFASGPGPKEKRAVPADDGMFEGIGPGTCANGCGNGFCVITRDANCAHPMTSPLQPAYFSKPDVMARYTRAKKYCARMRLDKLLEAGLVA